MVVRDLFYGVSLGSVLLLAALGLAASGGGRREHLLQGVPDDGGACCSPALRTLRGVLCWHGAHPSERDPPVVIRHSRGCGATACGEATWCPRPRA